MHYRLAIINLLIIFCLSSCQSINDTRENTGIPQFSVIFSFDDGPDEHTTAKLLDILNKHQITAIFCLLGKNAEQYPELARRINNEGHYIINHGYSGRWVIGMNKNNFRNNLLMSEKAISAAIGQKITPKLYRPHGGYYNSKQREILTEENYHIVPATIRAYDANESSANIQWVINTIIKKSIKNNGGIILLHDGRDSYSQRLIELEKNPEGPYNRSWIPEAVEEIIRTLSENGFNFPNPENFINSLVKKK